LTTSCNLNSIATSPIKTITQNTKDLRELIAAYIDQTGGAALGGYGNLAVHVLDFTGYHFLLNENSPLFSLF
jgi:hypothetical protein